MLEFMYTAKLTLSPENVEDVLAVATFLQMQEVVEACNTLRALSAPAGLEIPTVAGRALSCPWVRFPFSPQTLGLSERKPSSPAGPQEVALQPSCTLGRFQEPTFPGCLRVGCVLQRGHFVTLMPNSRSGKLMGSDTGLWKTWGSTSKGRPCAAPTS